MKNIIIREALNICYGEIAFDDIEDEDDEPIDNEHTDKTFYETHPGLYEYQMAKRCFNSNSESFDIPVSYTHLISAMDM